MPYTIKQLPLLPGEIQDAILKQMTLKQCWRCASVCQGWRAMILNWQPLWETLSTPDRPDLTDLLDYAPLIHSSSVKRIYVRGSSEYLHEIFNFIDTQQLSSITHVDLNLDYFTLTDFDMLVKQCGNTILDITMRVRLRDQRNVRPDAFLQRCPNLIRLYFDGWISHPQSWHPRLDPHPLSELALRFANIDDFDFDPTPFLQALPKLKRLRLDNFNIPITSSLQYCPELKILANFQDHDGQVPTVGRKKLLLADTHAVPEVFDLIQQWSQNLELLYLDISHQETLERLATLVFPSLTFIYIHVLEDNWGPTLRLFFTSSTPNVSTLQIDYIDDSVLDGLATATKSLNHLSLSRSYVSASGLARFFNQVDLHKLTLRFDYTHSYDCLDVLEVALHKANNRTRLDVVISVYVKHLLPSPSRIEKLLDCIDRNVQRWRLVVDASSYLKCEHPVYQGTTSVEYRKLHHA